MPEESELDQAAEWLERFTKDATARGRVTILAVNEVAPRPRYQSCVMTVRVEAPGFEPLERELEYMVRREHWPSVGDVLPATVHVERPERTEIHWEQARPAG